MSKDDDKVNYFLVGLGRTLLVLGIVGAIYFFFIFDTTVAVDPDAVVALGAKRIHNIGLMNEKQTGVIASMCTAILGSVLMLLDKKRV